MFDTLADPSPFAAVNDYGGPDYTEMNKGVTPIFWVEPVKDELATEQSGAVRYRELEMVRIIVAGDPLSAATSPVDDGIKNRFAAQYERWKRNRAEHHIDGTPLKHWPLLTPAQIMEMRALNIESVEQLAVVTDAHITRIQDGRVWREKAKGWLMSAQDNGAAAKLAAENERLRQELARSEATVDDLGAQLQMLQAQNEPGAGQAAPRGRRAS